MPNIEGTCQKIVVSLKLAFCPGKTDCSQPKSFRHISLTFVYTGKTLWFVILIREPFTSGFLLIESKTLFHHVESELIDFEHMLPILRYRQVDGLEINGFKVKELTGSLQRGVPIFISLFYSFIK